jgi:hypothetical protein
MLTRRQWIGSGVVAAAALGVAGLIVDSAENNRDILSTIVPVMLEGALPVDSLERQAAIRRTVDGFDVAVAGLTPSVQGEVSQLLALLRIAPLRIVATGIAGPWGRTSPERIGQFLHDWRYSPVVKLRSAYDALHQLIFAAYYGNPKSWPGIRYPGPPVVKL